MSRIGKQEINIPENVDLKLEPNLVTVKGPKGTLQLIIPASVSIGREKNILTVRVSNPEVKSLKALWGTIQRLIVNNIKGVTDGFSRRLNITGVGYRANIEGKKLVLELGYSHKIDFLIPDDLEIKTEGNNVIVISGIDKQVVGQAAAKIRSYRKPEPYKGKGISYAGEVIRRKAGKQAATASR